MEEKLILSAIEARKKSYSPYSNFKVGAAIITNTDKIYTGCNIENVAYSPSNCAERTAIFKAVSEGEMKFKAIAIVGGKDQLEECFPCGVCRQVLTEFCDKEEFKIIIATSIENYKVYTLKELLPNSFSKEML